MAAAGAARAVAADGGLVVVGAGLAGLRAVEGARAAGWDGPLRLIGAEVHPPYDRPPLSKAALAPDAVRSPDATPLRSAAELADLDLDLVLGRAVISLDPTGRRVCLSGGEAVGYDRLVVATGCRPLALPDAVGAGLAGVHTLRTHDDAQAVAAALDELEANGGRLVVVGAGFIGSEIASGARGRGIATAIVERLGVPLSRSLGERPGEICAGLHRAAGTELHLGRGVRRLLGADGRVTGVELEDGAVLPADLVIVGIGVRPDTGWLAGSGLELDTRDGGIVCGPTLRTSAPGVWAAGDVTHVPHATFDGEVMRLEHWTSAADQGGIAGRNAAASLMDPAEDTGKDAGEAGSWAHPGPDEERVEAVPYFWSDWYGHRIQFVGAPAADETVALGPEGPGAIVLYRRGDRLAGTLTVDRPRDIMKFRRQVMGPGSWASALELAESRLATDQSTGRAATIMS